MSVYSLKAEHEKLETEVICETENLQTFLQKE